MKPNLNSLNCFNMKRTRVSRRQFLLGAFWLAAGGPAALGTLLSSCKRKNVPGKNNELELILMAVLEVVWPSTRGVPDLTDLNSVGYIMKVLDDEHFDPDIREHVRTALKELNLLSLETYGRAFQELNKKEGEKLMVSYCRKSGYKWLEWLMNLFLESLLGDPVYGVNGNGVGWKWLNHFPGYPGPDSKTKYPELWQNLPGFHKS